MQYARFSLFLSLYHSLSISLSWIELHRNRTELELGQFLCSASARNRSNRWRYVGWTWLIEDTRPKLIKLDEPFSWIATNAENDETTKTRPAPKFPLCFVQRKWFSIRKYATILIISLQSASSPRLLLVFVSNRADALRYWIKLSPSQPIRNSNRITLWSTPQIHINTQAYTHRHTHICIHRHKHKHRIQQTHVIVHETIFLFWKC